MKFGKIMLALALVFCAVTVQAQSKIGVVNPNRVIQECKKGKAFFAELEKFRQSKEGQMKTKIDAFQAKQKDAQAKAASMSDDKKRELAADLEKDERELKRMNEDFQREAQLKLNEGLEKFQKELGPLIRQIALEKGFDLVFNDGQASGIVFRAESTDITDDVIKKYDEMN